MHDIEKLDRELVAKGDLEALTGLLPSIQHDFDAKPVFRTETEARVSVLNEIHFPTPHAKYWQSVREQQVHFDQLVYLSFDYRRKKVELKKLEAKLTDEADELERELISIDIEQTGYELMVCRKVAEERVREIKQWDTIKKELVEKHPDEVNTEGADVGVYQVKSYAKRFIREMFNSGNNIAAADAQNIIGKAITAKNHCKELGIWDEVVREMRLTPDQLKALGETVEAKVLKEFSAGQMKVKVVKD